MDKKPELSPLPCEALRWNCNPDIFSFENTSEINPEVGTVGQDTARDALLFGIQCLSPGQNVYVRGARGTGRMRMVQDLLKEAAPSSSKKRDFCYVQNFQRPEQPRLITLPPGTAGSFRKQMEELADFITNGLHKALSEEPYDSARNAIHQQIQQELRELSAPLEADLAEAGLALVSMQNAGQTQSAIFPIVDGKPVPPDQLRMSMMQAPDEETQKAIMAQLKKFEEDVKGFQKQMQETGKKIAVRLREGKNEMKEFHERAAREMLEKASADLREDFDIPRVTDHIDEIINETIEYHLGEPEPGETKLDLAAYFGVNVVLTHRDRTARPVILELMPSMLNLLGTVEPDFGPGGMAISDYRGIRGGALLNADEGYLVIDVNDILSEPGAWRALMRTLRTGKLEIVPPEAGWMRQYVVTQPEPIDINVRVILIGDVPTYYRLDHVDPDFRELFKVLADFDSEIARNDEGAMQYARVVAGLASREDLPPFDPTAIAALTEHGARIVSRAGKLTARFGRIADIAREAAFLAGDRTVTGDDIKQAVSRTKARASLPSRKFQEMVESETIIVKTEGEVVGQINGLAVIRSGPLTYGFPARITATIGPGSAGIINVEGRAQMSGSIHTKGFHILGGLIRHLLNTRHPLAFSASLAFEQSYGGIDGDSASGAEVICLLSELTGIPVRQSMAITGAIDQRGNFEAIGGVNEKIEGFFDACEHFGFNGQQGVVVPKANAADLMLREDVVEACREGKFHVYAVDSILDAFELMTGHAAGELDKDGEYPEGTMLHKAIEKAREFWQLTMTGPKKLTKVEKDPPVDEQQPVPHPLHDRDG
ncbi:MAG: ATP-binding protein [Planctomycetota bacterium]